MINNLKDVITNINDLLELKKERLRQIHLEALTLEHEIVELENGKAKLVSTDIHFVVSNNETNNETKIEAEKYKRGRKNRSGIIYISEHAILAYIRENPRASMRQLQKYFNCKADALSHIYRMLRSRQVIRDGKNELGKNTFSAITDNQDKS